MRGRFPADEVAASGIHWLGERLSAGATPQVFGGNRRADHRIGAKVSMEVNYLPSAMRECVARELGRWGTQQVCCLGHYNPVVGIGINGECPPQPGDFLALAGRDRRVRHTEPAHPRP